MTDRVERFRTAVAANAGAAHGPVPAAEAGVLAARLALARAGGRPVAVTTGDRTLDEPDVLAPLQAAGARVLRPDDAGWRDAIGRAGAGITGAAFGLATTGTVGVRCGPGAPRAVSLVPPAHVCLLRLSDLVDDLEAAISALGPLPSAMTWISGPSRSADLEMTLTLGVHGPASVDVVLWHDTRDGGTGWTR